MNMMIMGEIFVIVTFQKNMNGNGHRSNNTYLNLDLPLSWIFQCRYSTLLVAETLANKV